MPDASAPSTHRPLGGAGPNARAAERDRVRALLAPIAPHMKDVDAALRDITQSRAPYVEGLVEHVRGFGGKRLRPALVILAGRAVDSGAVGQVHARVGAVVELIHTATLVHDDILDGALIRRNRATLHHLEGTEVSVLLGDFLLASAYAEAAALEDRLASRYLSEVTRQVCQGEVLQVHNRGNLHLGMGEYLEIIQKKTAVLYEASCEVGARYAGGSDEQVDALSTFGLELGMAFQIIDDVLDLTGDEDVVGKSLGTDLARGKLTLPLIHFLRHGSDDDVAFVRGAIEDGSAPEHVGRIRAAVAATGSVDAARDEAQIRLRRATNALDELPRSSDRELLRTIAEYVAARRR